MSDGPPEAGTSRETGTSPETGASIRRLVVGTLKESAPGERRVAIVPESVARLEPLGIDVVVETGAGSDAWFDDDAYVEAGAAVAGRDDVIAQADVLVIVGTLPSTEVATLRAGQALIGMLRPLIEPSLAQLLAAQGVTAVSLDGLPRTVSRAQTMDALSSQANLAGYKAALVAADTFGRYFPLLITAAGTAKPASVLVLGAGVAGLQAMGTARRLGAVVTGYDVRPETRAEIESVGARFLELRSIGEAAGEGGYARALTESEQAAQQEELNALIARFDVVITTAQVPGRRPPLLVTSEALKQMRSGSVLVDVGASPLGGNVEGSVPDGTVRTDNGVTIIGAGNLPSQVPTAASAAYSNNVTALLKALVTDGQLRIDLEDDIQAGVVTTHAGRVVHPAVAALVDQSTPAGGQP